MVYVIAVFCSSRSPTSTNIILCGFEKSPQLPQGRLGKTRGFICECQESTADHVNIKSFTWCPLGIWDYNRGEVSHCSKSLCETVKEDQRRSAACRQV